MPTVIDWNCALKIAELNIHLMNATQMHSAALSGYTQVGSNISAYWRVDIQLTNTPYNRLHYFNTIVAALGGREYVLRFPLPAAYFCSYLAYDYIAAPHDNDVPFSDGSGYVNKQDGIGAVTVAKGANVLTFDQAAHEYPIQPGQFFGIGEHLYKAIIVTDTTINFAPSARVSYTDEPVKLAPTVLCRLSESGGGAFKTPRSRIYAPSLSLTEALL